MKKEPETFCAYCFCLFSLSQQVNFLLFNFLYRIAQIVTIKIHII